MDDIEAKYAELVDPGIREFMIAGERFYPADAVNFSLAEQRKFYNRYCAHFAKVLPAAVAIEDFKVHEIKCRRYLPPAFLVAAGLDPSHDDCADYAAKLAQHGIAAHVRHEPLLVHAFLRARHMSEPAAKSFAAVIAAVRRFAS